MFENIDQLEKEIREFEKNIIASKDLIQSIRDTITAIRDQNEKFGLESDRLMMRLSEIPDEVSEKNDIFLSQVSKEYESSVMKIQAFESLLENKHGSTLVSIEDKFEALNDVMQNYKEKLLGSSDLVFSRINGLVESVSLEHEKIGGEISGLIVKNDEISKRLTKEMIAVRTDLVSIKVFALGSAIVSAITLVITIIN